MRKAQAAQPVQHPFTGMPERGMPQVMSQGDGLCQVFIEAQRPRDGARDLHNLQRMRHALAEMVAAGRNEHLRLVL